MAAARTAKMGSIVEVRFYSTQCHANADGLSRLPLNQGCSLGHYDDPGIFNLAQIDSLPVDTVDFHKSRQST